MSEQRPPVEFTLRNRIGFWLGLALFFLFLFLDPDPERPALGRMLAVTLLMATWWITEAVPIPVTALLPVPLFPLLGIEASKDVAPNYMNSSIFLFMGGFILALAIEKWGLHRRIALNVLRVIGVKPRLLVLGFMIATAFLSMWISNTATAMLMLPIGLSVINRLGPELEDPKRSDRFALVLMISIAYAASIGGTATLIGTPPNLAFTRIFAISYPDAPEISFSIWFAMAFPLAAVFLVTAWALLTRVIFPVGGGAMGGVRSELSRERRELGPMEREEKSVLVVFVLTALLWIFRADIPLGGTVLRGWASRLGVTGVDDATVAMSAAVVLFLIPARRGAGRLMDWTTARRLPWGILILFGGGFALASGFQASELTEWLGRRFLGLEGTSPHILVLATSTLLTFLTEVTSNTATTQIILPILASASATLRVHPLLLMIPATLSASCAFMLPVATPPNAIVFGSRRVPIQAMVKAGIVMNLAGIVLIFLTVTLLGAFLFGITAGAPPEWA
ncbi:MAG: DASS family sodium-coupled anion symporter [Candidatus Eisenbacteria bacterium]